jgi:hypothetical protein
VNCAIFFLSRLSPGDRIQQWRSYVASKMGALPLFLPAIPHTSAKLRLRILLSKGMDRQRLDRREAILPIGKTSLIDSFRNGPFCDTTI